MAKPSKQIETDPSKPSVTTAFPLVPFKVVASGIPFFRDKECTQRVAEATLLILQTLDPEDEIQEFDIVPTTKVYQVGDYVNLAFDNKKIWEDCYYRDPEDGEIRRAWRIHVDFIGQLIAPETVEKNRERLAELEAGVQAKIDEIARRSAGQTPIN